ncbi:hypothetical protein BJY17_000939 [Agromyces hippuratus]|uniref:Lipoprotein n=1 Tax=Agromyces hippuratus TaxID=286438 RepID=A0A852WPT7_9MICO|nr:hypothetical protein [Agromyces hippuratus]NYG20192.1 hypothetical protein [Agromyces hippuratus]
MTSSATTVLTASVAALAAISLSGCGPLFPGYREPMAARLNGDGTIAFAICGDLLATQIAVTSVQAEDTASTLWLASGTADLTSGMTVTTGTAPGTMTEVVPVLPGESGRSVFVEIEGLHQREQRLPVELVGVFRFDDLTDDWTWSRGTGGAPERCPIHEAGE